MINYSAGFTKIKTRDYRDYLLGTFLGLIPSSFVYAFLGSSLNDMMSLKFFQAILIFIPVILIAEKYRQRSDKAKLIK